jgi:hypothetical protein
MMRSIASSEIVAQGEIDRLMHADGVPIATEATVAYREITSR